MPPPTDKKASAIALAAVLVAANQGWAGYSAGRDVRFEPWMFEGFGQDKTYLPGSHRDRQQKLLLVTDAPFNAVTTGNTDAHLAIQAAINMVAARGGGIVFFPAGTFRIGATLLVPSNVTLCGCGPATILKAKANLDTIMIRSDRATAPFNTDITIRDMTIDGNRANQTAADLTEGAGIKMYAVKRLLIENVWVKETIGHGIHLNNLGGITEGQRLSHVYVSDVGWSVNSTYGSCFATTNAYNITFANCHAYRSYKAGFRLSGDGILLDNCIAMENGNGGVVPVSGSNRRLVISGGTFANSTPSPEWPCDGIRLVAAKDVKIVGANIYGNADCGIALLNGCDGILIDNVVINNNGKASTAFVSDQKRSGIAVFDSGTPNNNVIIRNASIYDDQAVATQDYGVEVSGSPTNVTIDDCIFGTAQVGPIGLLNSTNSVRIGSGNIGLSLPSRNPAIDSAVSGTTATTAMQTTTIKANEFGRRGAATIVASGVYTGANGTKTISVTINGTSTITFPASVSASANAWRLVLELVANGTTSVRMIATLFQDTDVSVQYNAAVVDTTADWTIAIRGKLSVTGDTILLRTFDATRAQ